MQLKLHEMDLDEVQIDGQVYAMLALAVILGAAATDVFLLVLSDDVNEPPPTDGWCAIDNEGYTKLYHNKVLKAKVIFATRGAWYAWAWLTGGGTMFAEGGMGDEFTPWVNAVPANLTEPD